MSSLRLFQRINFAMRSEVTINGTLHRATLGNISIKGALVAFHDQLDPKEGLPCSLTVHLDHPQVRLSFEAVIVHSDQNLTGMKFTGMKIDTMIHLRRLLELNSGEPDQVRSELRSLIEAG